MKQHKVFLDILRIVATAMVVMIHCSGWFYVLTPPATTAYDTNVFGILSASAVPLFFMISGSIFLSQDYDFSLKKLIRKIMKVIIILAVWGGLYAILDMKQFSLEKLVIWTYKGHFHFWFFEYLIGIYLLIPVLRAATFDKSIFQWALICWIIWGIIIYTLKSASKLRHHFLKPKIP